MPSPGEAMGHSVGWDILSLASMNFKVYLGSFSVKDTVASILGPVDIGSLP